MNEFQRRLLDVVKYTSYIASFADPARKVLGVEGYAYTVDQLGLSLTLAAPLANPFNLIMDSDSDFVATYMSAGALTTGTGLAQRQVEYSPSLLLQVTDQSSGKTWFNGPMPSALVCGAMGFPFILSSPRVIKPRTTLSVLPSAAVTLTGSNTFTAFFFVLGGAKIYYTD
jgi:hypothetical protein